MPKMKTNKAAKKRYSYTATGKVKRTTSNRGHLKDNKNTKQKRRLRAQNAYAAKSCEAGIKKLLPNGTK